MYTVCAEAYGKAFTKPFAEAFAKGHKDRQTSAQRLAALRMVLRE